MPISIFIYLPSLSNIGEATSIPEITSPNAASLPRQLFTDKPIIGVGGIFTGMDAYNFLNAGANLLQGFTGFIYRGPLYAVKVASELDKVLNDKGIKNISEIKKYLH